nr:MAG TPA: hypothetical protein [Caudoviricetes sp.]
MTQNIFDTTVETLIKDAKALTEKYNSYVNVETDPKKYVLTSKMSLDTLRLLKDTLSLIKEYDWHLEYSESETDYHKKVAVWEQNHSGEIRNKKDWIVGNTTMYIDYGIDETIVYVNRRKYCFDLNKDKAAFIYTITNYYNNGNTTIYVDSMMDFGKYVCDLLDNNDISYNLIRNMCDRE